MPDGSLSGRVALVTGGGRGIGRAISLQLAGAGAAVGVNYRRGAEEAEEVAELIRKGGGKAVALQGSVADREEVEALAEAALAELGPIDILINNAGVASRGNSVADTDPTEFDRLISTHAIGPARLVQLILPGMRQAARGDIVMISSSEVAHMRPNGSPYNMAKSAMEALALTLANEEIGNGIHVNVVAPGLVATDMGDRLVKAGLGIDEASELDAGLPLGRVCRPDDVANVVSFVVSEAASYMTGQKIIVDGGADASPAGKKPTE